MDPKRYCESYGFGIIGRRWLAAWLDVPISFGVLLLAQYLLGDELYKKTVLIWVTVALGYFVVFEVQFGATVGKMIAGVVVVNAKGEHPSWGQAIIRALLRILEVGPLAGGAIAGIVALCSESKQRLGDLLARTYVITRHDYNDMRFTLGVTVHKSVFDWACAM